LETAWPHSFELTLPSLFLSSEEKRTRSSALPSSLSMAAARLFAAAASSRDMTLGGFDQKLPSAAETGVIDSTNFETFPCAAA